jgi:phosphomannomutase
MNQSDHSIRFGTDGWRGVIARDFTFRNLRRVAQATADYFQTISEGSPTLIVGYDVRFLSPQFARAAAEVLAGNGFRVLLMDRITPTPYVSFAVRESGLRAGVVITASHNPAEFNGFKVKAHYGGSATADTTAAIEACLDRNPVAEGGEVEMVGMSDAYADHLRTLVDWPALRKSRLKVCVDSMHGSGGTLLEEFLKGTTLEVHTIRSRPDPLFGGVSPEPMMPWLEPLAREVVARNAAVGLATDGDGDRLGVVAEDGTFLSTLQVLPLLLLHVVRNRGWTGAVAHTFSQSQLVGRIAGALGLETYETPIGFKYIAELMIQREILIGGEESGGIGLSRHLPERDGLFLHLLILDMIATLGKPLKELIGAMWAEFGEFHYARRDLHVPIELSRQMVEELAENPPERLFNQSVRNVLTLDGVKLVLEGDSWILFRRSGTEPVLRVYCEAPTPEATEGILEEGVALVEQFSSSGVS